MSEGRKYEVYFYLDKDSTYHFFSEGVRRQFGENKVIRTEDESFMASVMPLQDKHGLELIGHIYAA